MRLFMLFLVLTVSCGGEELIPLGSSGAGLVGFWRGSYTVLSNNGVSKSFEVDINFKKDGAFTLRHLSVGNSASGTYTEVAKKKQVVMSIRESSIAAFKLQSQSSKEYDYALDDDTLELTSPEVTYKLTRRASPLESLAMDGQWYCPSETQGFRRFFVQGNSFWMTLTENTGISYFMRGKVTYETASLGQSAQKAVFELEEVRPHKDFPSMTAYLLKDAKTSESLIELVSLKDASFKENDFSSVECRGAASSTD